MKTKQLSRRNIIWLTIAVISLLFVLQNRVRNHNAAESFARRQVVATDTQLADTINTLFANTQRHTAVVPAAWYATDGYMTPTLAGFIDGAWAAGVSVYDLTLFVHCYTADTACRQRTNHEFASLWQMRAELPALVGTQLNQWSGGIAGAQGAAHAEYLYGRLLFDAAIMLVGVGEVTEGLQTTKLGSKLLTGIEKARLQKLARIEQFCVPCAKIFQNSTKLRENLVSLPQTKQLLANDFARSGKLWDEFIKDYDAHHIIPVDLLEESEGLQWFFNNGGKLDFNSVENGIMVKRFVKGEGVHAKHNAYSNQIKLQLETLTEDVEKLNLPIPNKIKIFEQKLRYLISDTKQLIIEKSINDNVKINSLWLQKQ